VTTGIQKNSLDTGVRRYDKLNSDTHFSGAVLSAVPCSKVTDNLVAIHSRAEAEKGEDMANPARKKILVVVDGSEHSLDAVRYTAKIVPAEGVEIVLFHIATRVPESFWDVEREPAYHYRFADIREWETQQQKMIQEFMSQACDLLYAANIQRESVRATVRDRNQGIAQDIIAESQDNYDAVVVGRRGLSELKDFVLGSIANKLVEKLVHVPVWIVGAKQQRGKCLVCLDASEGAMLAVDYVAGLLGRSPHLEITLLHVVREFDFFHRMVGKSQVPSADRAWKEKLEDELEQATEGINRVFEEATNRLAKGGVAPGRVDQKVVKGASTIVDEAEQGGYDTIVVGRRGLSKVQEFFMGRVSNKVIHLAKDKTVWVVS
jgi:nucleotide-binding universal stress UspA family protein